MEVKLNLEKYRGKWYARGSDAFGGVIRSSLRLDDSKPEREALMALGVLAQKISDNGGKRLIAGEVIRYQQLADLYMDKPDARKDWVSKIKHSETKWGRTPITDIDEAAVLQWEQELLAEGLQPATVKRYFNMFRAALTYGCRRLRLPLPDIPNIGADGDARVVVIPNDVRLKIFNEMTVDLRWYYLTLAFTGARPSELLNLRWRDVNMEDSVMWLSSQKGKKGAPLRRAVAFSSEVKSVMLDIVNWFGISGRDEYVFKMYDGEAWADKFEYPASAVLYRLKQAAEKAGLESGVEGGIFSYAFRHTFASKVAASGVTNGMLLSKYIGHKNTQTTVDHYVHSGVTETDQMVKGLR